MTLAITKQSVEICLRFHCKAARAKRRNKVMRSPDMPVISKQQPLVKRSAANI